MDHKDGHKRKKVKHDDYEHKSSKRTRSKSRSPYKHSEKDSRRKRRHSRSESPSKNVKQEKVGKENELHIVPNAKKDIPVRKAKETDMLNTRTGGAYIPPARLRMMQAQITDKSSVAYQRLAWEALKKSIHGHINKINVGNIGIIIKELLKENIVRGRGLLCRSVIQAQAASPTFTNVYAALVAAVNSRFPNIGELLLKRLVIQFKRGFKRNDKPICISSASFIAHLVNQRVAHEILALELLTLLVETPTDDSVEVAIAFLKECGQKLTEVSSKGVNAIFEMLRNILHEGQVDKRVQYMIEVMFQVWKDGFKDHPALIEELELVPEEEQFTHLLMLDDATDSQDILNVFKFDDKYEENEQKYKTLSKEILGSDAESGEDGSEESGSEESEEEEAEEEKGGVTIIDNTETNLVALRRTIYLTINSSLDFEECAHKLMKMQLKPGQEIELCHMFLDCCAEQRTYEKFYGLLAQRFCNINRMYIGPFEEIFKDSYGTAHRLDTNRLRNVSKFFAHLLFTDSISWEALECVKLNEEDTTSSSRIYIKILFQELAEYMGLKKLNDRLKDPTLQVAFAGIFPRDNPKNTRFSINFFTSIGLGGLTDELREHLKQMPKNVPAPVQEINVDSDSSSSSSSSDSSSSESSSSDSETDDENSATKNKELEKTRKTPADPEEAEKNKERWGHDGFYDTYGKDARRLEKRPEHSNKDRDTFVKPQDAPRRNNQDRYREREYDQSNNSDKRRREDDNSYDETPVRNNKRYDREDRRQDSYDEKRVRNNERYDREDRRQDSYDETRVRNNERYNREDRRQDKNYRGQRNTDNNKETSSRENRGKREENSYHEQRSKSSSNKEDRRKDRYNHKDENSDSLNSSNRKDGDRTKRNSDQLVNYENSKSKGEDKPDRKPKADRRREKDSGDDSDSQIEKEKDRKKGKKDKKRRSSSDAEQREKPRDSKKHTDRSRKDKEHAQKADDDGWDIRRGSSIQRDLGERYWTKS